MIFFEVNYRGKTNDKFVTKKNRHKKCFCRQFFFFDNFCIVLNNAGKTNVMQGTSHDCRGGRT